MKKNVIVDSSDSWCVMHEIEGLVIESGKSYLDLFTPHVNILNLAFLLPITLTYFRHQLPVSMALIQDLSTEILLEIFLYIHLKSIISCRGVCTLWRDLVLVADLHPVRRRLLRVYYSILETEIFHDSRPRTLQVLQPFIRDAYLASLRRQSSPNYPLSFQSNLRCTFWNGQSVL
jgi:hypothetical protein